VKKSEGDRLIQTIRELMDEDRGGDTRRREVSNGPAQIAAGPATVVSKLQIDRDQLEAIYVAIKNRLIDELRVDPILLQLIAQRPEIVVEIEPQIVTIDGATLKGRIGRLIAGGWFMERRATSAVRRELARIGNDPGGGGTLSEKLSELKREGFLISEGDGWLQAPGIKISERVLERA
jgi:hypothetical protein